MFRNDNFELKTKLYTFDFAKLQLTYGIKGHNDIIE